jgi:recombination protein RecA
VKVVKNKMAPPFRETEFDILFGKGISREGDLIDLGTDIGVVEKSGSWYSFEGERLGQGRENSKETLVQNPSIALRIDTLIRTHFGLAAAPPAATT